MSRIILTAHQFFPEFTSGTEVLTLAVARELRRRGHEVLIFTGFPAQRHFRDDERLDRYEYDELPVIRFQHAVVPMGEQIHVTELEYCNLLAARFFKQVVEDFRPDVIHFFHLSRLGAALMDVAFTAAIPAFYTPTDFWAICPTSQLLLSHGVMCPGPGPHGGNCVKHVACLTRGAMTRRVLAWVPDAVAEVAVNLTARGCLPPYRYHGEVAALSSRKTFIGARLNALQGIVSPTRLMTQLLVDNGVSPERIVQSAYGIDTSSFEQLRERTTVEPHPVTIGFIGTLAQHKGCHVVLQALAQMPSLPVRLKVYGRSTDFPDYYAHLSALASGDARIEFCGSFPNSAIADVIAGLDLLVVPSVWYENTPLVIYSALAGKCPVAASDLPGMAEAVTHDVNGLLFAAGDAKALALQLRRVLDEPDLLPRLRQHCRPPKSAQAYVQELLDLYAAPGLPVPKTPWLSIAAAMRQDPDAGSLSGWAVLQGAAPVAVQLVANQLVVCEDRQLGARPDVVDGLQRSGQRMRSTRLGFALRPPPGCERAQCHLVLHGPSGQQQQIPMSSLTPGQVAAPAPDTLVAIDHERWGPAPVTPGQ